MPLTHIRAIVSSWFQRWNNVIIPQLFNISKWETGHPYLKKGDLCLLHQNKGKCRLQSYKHCRVNRAIPSAWDAKVCTVEINYSAKAVTTALNTVFGIRNLPNKITTDAGKTSLKAGNLSLNSWSLV